MKKDFLDYTAAMEYIKRYYNNGEDTIADFAEGVLLDSVLYCGKASLCALVETYATPNSSIYTRYIATSKHDKNILYDLFDQLNAAAEEEEY